MGTGLFDFFYFTMVKRLNDPQNTRYFLPTLLQGMKNTDSTPVLPLHADEWNLGTVKGKAAPELTQDLTDGWWSAVPQTQHIPMTDPIFQTDHAIACPDKPSPSLRMTGVTVSGLDNLRVLPNPVLDPADTGYSTVIPLQFNAWPDGTTVTVDGRYFVNQCVCSASNDNSAQCDGKVPAETIDGGGLISLQLTDFCVDAHCDVVVSGTGAGRTFALNVTQLVARGPAGASSLPTLTVNKLTIDSSVRVLPVLWLQHAETALQQPDTIQSLVTQMNATLNTPANLARLSDTLTTKARGALDDALGAGGNGNLPDDAGQQAPTPVDLYIFDRFRFSLNDPQSPQYLPVTVQASGDPQLEPFALGDIPLGDLGNAQFPLNAVTLQQVIGTGISNIVAPPPQFLYGPQGFGIVFAIGTLSPPPPGVPPPPLTIQGPFAFSLRAIPLTGRQFRIDLTSATVTANVLVSGADLESLVLTIQSLHLDAPLSALTITIQLDSAFAPLINSILTQDQVKTRILDRVNGKLADPALLQKLSARATTQLRTIIAGKLDG